MVTSSLILSSKASWLYYCNISWLLEYIIIELVIGIFLICYTHFDGDGLGSHWKLTFLLETGRGILVWLLLLVCLLWLEQLYDASTKMGMELTWTSGLLRAVWMILSWMMMLLRRPLLFATRSSTSMRGVGEFCFIRAKSITWLYRASYC